MGIEAITYIGILQIYQYISNVFVNRKNPQAETVFGSTLLYFLKIFAIESATACINQIEKILYYFMGCYYKYIYVNFKKFILPHVKSMPYDMNIGNGKLDLKVNASLFTLSRTALFIPISWLLKYNQNSLAFLVVIIHAFLGHVDGIVAKVHRSLYPQHDSPLLNNFLVAFCNKIVNILTLLVIFQSANFDNVSIYAVILYCVVFYAVIGYDSLISIIRVYDYFETRLNKEKTELEKVRINNLKETIKEVKLKRTLESLGLACLCLALDKSYPNPITNTWGLMGLFFLIITVRMAHKALITEYKLINAIESKLNSKKLIKSSSFDNLLSFRNEDKEMNKMFEEAFMDSVNAFNSNQNEGIEQMKYKKPKNLEEIEEEKEFEPKNNEVFKRSLSLDDDSTNEIVQKILKKKNQPKAKIESSKETVQQTERVDKVYTIGCFDLFHHGHIRLIERMREIGKTVIIGVHDSRSIFKLKKRVPVDSTEKRMLNVKMYADEVYCIAGTDPSNYISCIVDLKENETALYVRGDDMPDFPSRQVVEKLMPIKFLPYTQGVSSTQIRKEQFSHIKADDEEYLENNS